MSETKIRSPVQRSRPYHIRTLTSKGRYLAVGKLVPLEWVSVKVFVERRDSASCVLRLEPIK